MKIDAYPRTLRERIYYYLKESIKKGDLKANQAIQEKEISLLFGTSTTPVREAILKLEGEGFIQITSHKDAIVKETSFRELQEINQVIGHLDSLCMKSVIAKIPDEKIGEVEKMTNEMGKYAQRQTIDNYLLLNDRIHLAIWSLVENKFLCEIMHHIYGQLLRYNSQRVAFYEQRVINKSLKDHKLIVTFLKSRNYAKLNNLILQHWGAKFMPSSF